ncbi:MAG TPA: L,D-transpeptidase [Ktedonobacteraceae bacterium]|jgi:lipoprotein-anchoring transpeptidase ErfK/SrfK|nr:L,D-transpeptidase [Ktedonobacteraceae bacterium]
MQKNDRQKMGWQGRGWCILLLLGVVTLFQVWSSATISHARTASATLAVQQEVQQLQQQLQQEVNDWGAQNLYNDSYDGQTYSADYEYNNQQGIGGSLWLQGELRGHPTLAGYRQAAANLQMWLYNFQEMAANATDTTPYDQPHQADRDLLQHYGDMNKRAVIISLGEQALRTYDHGNLVNAMLVTTGEPALPTPPGNWSVGSKLHPTTFRSNAPKKSPSWYAPTRINYAMQYHSNGYFLHDAWWRTQFGPETNYPHQDPNGDPFASQGSHGCVNMSLSDATWLYNFVSSGTPVIIY